MDVEAERKYELAIVKLAKSLGYDSAISGVPSTELIFYNHKYAPDTVMLALGQPLAADGWQGKMKKLAEHLANGKPVFIGTIVTKDTDGVAEFLVECDLLVFRQEENGNGKSS